MCRFTLLHGVNVHVQIHSTPRSECALADSHGVNAHLQIHSTPRSECALADALYSEE